MSKTFIYASSAISTQNSFEGNSINNFTSIESSKSLIEPEYKEYIKPMMIRRMSKATKMSVACSFKCMADINLEQPDAIIVGTGLGALAHTVKFLQVSTTAEEKVLPPTSFIQSGHNTIAGQIALLLGTDCYNMTHVQQAISFENALMDAQLNIGEGKQAVLTGAVDEHIDILDDLANRFNIDNQISSQFSEGCGFFILGPDESTAKVELLGVSILRENNIAGSISTFLAKYHLQVEDINMGFIGYNLTIDQNIDLPFEVLCYTDFGGRHFSSSAFGFYLAVMHLQQEQANNYTLVVNIASENDVGLTILKSF